jgi:hypothetical protein
MTTWPPLVLVVVEEQGMRQGSGGFPSLAALRDRTSLRFRELTPTTNLGPCNSYDTYSAT